MIPTTTPQPRTVDAIDQAIASVRAAQRTKLAARDRAERAMLTALADVERYEQQARDDDARLEDLFAEREHARHPERFAPDTQIRRP